MKKSPRHTLTHKGKMLVKSKTTPTRAHTHTHTQRDNDKNISNIKEK